MWIRAFVLVAALAVSACEDEAEPVSCPAGDLGCPCAAGDACDADLVCEAGACIPKPCPAGMQGCACLPTGTCREGDCEYGTCVLPLPSEVRCFSPCEQGLIDDAGAFVECPADGLMAGCVDDLVCTDGSCVPPGEAAPTCVTGAECPDFQTCIQGRCCSNCDIDDDCPGTRACYRHVCRLPCTAATDTCLPGSACLTVDGENGHCMPLSAAGDQPQTHVTGEFSLSSELVEFSSTTLSGTLTLTNDSPAPVTFTVRKLQHVEYPATGAVTISTNPLHWLHIGVSAAEQVQEFEVSVDGDGGSADILFANAANATLPRWTGRLEIMAANVGRRLVNLSYVSLPDGQWRGKVYHFGNFDDRGLVDANNDIIWTDKDDAAGVNNALIKRWSAFRRGLITLDEWRAVMTATFTESWKWQSVRDLCEEGPGGCIAGGSNGACYLYSSPCGYGIYSDDLADSPIPSAMTQLPIAMNLRAASTSSPEILEGKIVTGQSLQYAGDPAVSLTFAGDPKACKAGVGSACLAPLASLDATILVGGRYRTTKGDGACGNAQPGTFVQAAVPWLVPGFEADTERDANTGLLYRYECRDTLQPFGHVEPEQNASFAQGNPIPDGVSRVRTIELVDGAMVNQREMVILFRETFAASFTGGEPFSAYGVMMLSRTPADLDDDAFAGNPAEPSPDLVTPLPDNECDPGLIEEVLGAGVTTIADATAAIALAEGIILGQPSTGSAAVVIGETPGHWEEVHYLCHDNGLFDGGPQDDGSASANKVACPAGSGVTYFTIDIGELGQEMIAGQPCQVAGNCQETLDLWAANGTHAIRLNPVWRCKEHPTTHERLAYCSENRMDLRAERDFYEQTADEPVFVPLLTAIDEAFRYKTRFRSRDGSTIGFAPTICVPNSNIIPYCYDPESIEKLGERITCALDLFFNYSSELATNVDVESMVHDTLERAFGYSQDTTTDPWTRYDGFERLNAELLIMLGDEAYTAAFASRFDLAGSNMVSFEGSLFEPGGINLAGAAGFEMYSLYKAAQYYQAVLDRFYGLSPYIWQSVQSPTQNFVDIESVVAYLDRLIRASTQKSRTWSEVAKRYQSFNRPDLARAVVERAYSSAYMESIIMSRLMIAVTDVTDPANRAQIVKQAEHAALGYRAALLDMRDVYAAITDDATLFGFAPDFIPFPALNEGDINAFTKSLEAAQRSLEVASVKEVLALEGNRAYETDAAMFQAELVTIRNNFENQLAELCGTFEGADGLVHPAIRTYAYLDPVAKLMGDPCGRAGNGAIHEAMVEVELVGLDMQDVANRYDQLFGEIAIEKARVEAQCKRIVDLAEYQWEQRGEINDLKEEIRDSERQQALASRAKDTAVKVGELLKCSAGTSTDCPTATIASAAVSSAMMTYELATTGFEILIGGSEEDIDEIEQATAKWTTLDECDLAEIDSDAKIKTLLLALKGLDLEALKTDYRMRLALAELEQLRNQATRLLAEKEETEQQTINIEAARNDPNVRIYRNDSIITADRTFHAAVRDAYKATKVFEYYTSQCHERLQNLFLVRMVSHGDYSLEGYLAELEEAYGEFEQEFGNPDLRVEILSLRDDIFAIPRIGDDGQALSEASRAAELRTRLGSVELLDERGYCTVPFSTSLEAVSPLTRNHKIHHIEVEVVGTDVGDTLGRIYVTQAGTGTVFGVWGDKTYYRFPERAAVLNPFFNGLRVFESEVYRNERMRDRPFVNTHWSLVLNQKDEHVNQDIDLGSLTDVRLYVYYTDFTQM